MRLFNLFRKHRLEREMGDEMRHHLDLLTAEHMAAGLSAEEARRTALREFGHIEGIKENARDVRGLPWLENIFHDLRYGVRMLRKAPGFATVAILTLALGIGATTAIFSVVNSVILRPLDFPDSHQLVLLQDIQVSTGRPNLISPATLLEWRKQNAAFSGIAGFTGRSFNLTGLGDPRRIHACLVTPDYLPTLGVQPMLGRTFRADEDTGGKGNVLILNYRFWKNQLGGREDILGQVVRLEERPFTIVGVMPAGFDAEPGSAAAYIPLVDSIANPGHVGAYFLEQVVGRLKPGITLAHAATELNLIGERLALAHPDTHRDRGVKLTPLLETRIAGVRPLLLILLAAVGFLLLIACVNVANLLLARASSRRKEISLRVALGASRCRVVLQLLAESVLLASLGGVLGALLAAASMRLLLGFAPGDLPRLAEVRIDGIALAVSLLITLLTGLGFGLVPALQSTRIDLTTALKGGGGAGESRSHLHRILVVTEIALALVLLVGAGLLARSFSHIRREYLGYDPGVVYVSRIQLPPQKYSTPAARLAFADRVHEQMLSKPGIRYHAFATSFPHHENFPLGIAIEGRSAPDHTKLPHASYTAVTPDYFQVMGNPLLAGRWFNAHDRMDSAPVALVGERFARLYFPGENPLGKRIARGDMAKPAWAEIVGVVTDIKHEGPTGVSLPQVYVPYTQFPISQFLCVERIVEGTPDPTSVVTAAIHAVDPTIPVPPKLVCIAEYVANSVSLQRFSLFIFGVFSVVALLLAAIGIYGVMAYSVSQRTSEFGVRLALGARRSDILRLILGLGSRLIALGLALGLTGAFATSYRLGSLLYNITPYDPLTLVAVAALLASVALLACWLPARRAMNVDPMTVLRTE